jgi:hypothetical protein
MHTSDAPDASSGMTLSEVHFARRVDVHKDEHNETSRSHTFVSS